MNSLSESADPKLSDRSRRVLAWIFIAFLGFLIFEALASYSIGKARIHALRHHVHKARQEIVGLRETNQQLQQRTAQLEKDVADLKKGLDRVELEHVWGDVGIYSNLFEIRTKLSTLDNTVSQVQTHTDYSILQSRLDAMDDSISALALQTSYKTPPDCQGRWECIYIPFVESPWAGDGFHVHINTKWGRPHNLNY